MSFGYWAAGVYFKLAGWRVEGELPETARTCVVVAAPHTSNWDLVYSRLGLYLLKIPAYYLLKKEWIRFPFKSFFEATGAIGVERSRSSNLVSDLVELLRNKEMALMISPEGTRRETRKWKTGFYQVALQANVPIALAYLDYKHRIAGIGPIIYPTGDYIKDMQTAVDFYKNITPCNPENFKLEIY